MSLVKEAGVTKEEDSRFLFIILELTLHFCFEKETNEVKDGWL